MQGVNMEGVYLYVWSLYVRQARKKFHGRLQPRAAVGFGSVQMPIYEGPCSGHLQPAAGLQNFFQA